MRIQIWILGMVIGLLSFYSCNDDDEDGDDVNGIYVNESPVRVKRITGENKVWGKYELEFNYRSDGLLKEVWRFGNLPYTEKRDTLGHFTAEYDIDYHEFYVIDYVLNIKKDSVDKLKELYPEAIADSIKSRLWKRTLYKTSLSEGFYTMNQARPPKDVWGDYINVASRTLMVENREDGRPLVIRCYEDIPGFGGDNGEYERSVCKYEFIYAGDDIVEGIVSFPDTYSGTSWTPSWKLSFSHYSGILTGVESDSYKMRRSANTVVIAEPGVNTTYTLNDYGVAVKVENTDGETATVEYEQGSGNFSELYATPLDKVLGKVWVK